jgi:hypothetical protein
MRSRDRGNQLALSLNSSFRHFSTSCSESIGFCDRCLFILGDGLGSIVLRSIFSRAEMPCNGLRARRSRNLSSKIEVQLLTMF